MRVGRASHLNWVGRVVQNARAEVHSPWLLRDVGIIHHPCALVSTRTPPGASTQVAVVQSNMRDITRILIWMLMLWGNLNGVVKPLLKDINSSYFSWVYARNHAYIASSSLAKDAGCSRVWLGPNVGKVIVLNLHEAADSLLQFLHSSRGLCLGREVWLHKRSDLL